MNIQEIRHKLHQIPEISGNEVNTSRYIRELLQQCGPQKLISGVGGEGLIAIWHGTLSGPTVLLRAELDALPIQEINDFEYRSTIPNVSHKCGHDGHMAILLGIADKLKETRDLKGTVILLFQPAEETGEGALRMLQDEKFSDIHVDYAFAMHNLPGVPIGKVLIRSGTFASASRGLSLEFLGKTSHAAHPENAQCPLNILQQSIQELTTLANFSLPFYRSALVTIGHIQMGEPAFGITPGYAKIMATLRAHRDQDIDVMAQNIESKISTLAKSHNIEHKLQWCEVFPAVVNNDHCCDLLQACAKNLRLDTEIMEVPVSWSEDFGHFLQKFSGAFFAIGSGTDHPQLHNPDYDFPDAILSTAVDLFWEVIRGCT